MKGSSYQGVALAGGPKAAVPGSNTHGAVDRQVLGSKMCRPTTDYRFVLGGGAQKAHVGATLGTWSEEGKGGVKY